MPLSEEYIVNFLYFLQIQKRYSAHTIIAYKTDLRDFYSFLSAYEFESPVQIKGAIVRTWLASLKEKDISSKTINRKISALKSFFKYLVKLEIIESSPMTTIISPKVNKRLPQFVEERDMHFLFNEVSFNDDQAGKMARLILEILYLTGLRKSELINLKVHDVDFYSKHFRVLGKGSKERIIPMNAYLAERIKEYIKEYMPVNYVFANARDQKLDPKFVYNLVKKYLSLITSMQKRSPHILRHSFATHLSNNGAELNAIKELLGHSSLAATQVYTHNNIEQLKKAFKNAHPKA